MKVRSRKHSPDCLLGLIFQLRITVRTLSKVEALAPTMLVFGSRFGVRILVMVLCQKARLRVSNSRILVKLPLRMLTGPAVVCRLTVRTIVGMLDLPFEIGDTSFVSVISTGQV